MDEKAKNELTFGFVEKYVFASKKCVQTWPTELPLLIPRTHYFSCNPIPSSVSRVKALLCTDESLNDKNVCINNMII